MSRVIRWLPHMAIAAGVALGVSTLCPPVQADPLTVDQPPVSTGKNIYELGYSSANNRLYVASAGAFGGDGGGQLIGLSTDPLKVATTLDLAQRPFGVAINDDAGRLYTTNTLNGSITAVDLDKGRVIRTLSLAPVKDKSVPKDQQPPQVRDVVVNPATGTVYVSGVSDNGVVWKVNGDTLELESTIHDVGAVSTGMVLDSASQRLYVANMGDASVSVIDLKTDTPVERIDVGKKPINLAVDADANRLYVANSGDNTVSVIDTHGNTTVKTLKVGEHPLGIDVDPGAKRLYVANRGDGTVQAFDTESFEVLETFHPGLHPNTVAVDTAAHRAFVTSKALSRHETAPAEGVTNTQGDVVTALTAPERSKAGASENTHAASDTKAQEGA
ncbi:YncE family protein [Larsenimonas salina]|uniref:YncE family protein n=1 Tax=Larsenimonas salina TaxID=1295565 RepID=UPI0020743D74|nr:YncE family protein [Larsenimonas salina]MCM5705408.1 YncE family protein [Larsenimonas salina]